jgi:hypothetical protein
MTEHLLHAAEPSMRGAVAKPHRRGFSRTLRADRLPFPPSKLERLKMNKNKADRAKVFSQPIRKLSAEELDAVAGGGPFSGDEIMSGPKSCSDMDNQGKNFS